MIESLASKPCNTPGYKRTTLKGQTSLFSQQLFRLPIKPNQSLKQKNTNVSQQPIMFSQSQTESHALNMNLSQANSTVQQMPKFQKYPSLKTVQLTMTKPNVYVENIETPSAIQNVTIPIKKENSILKFKQIQNQVLEQVCSQYKTYQKTKNPSIKSIQSNLKQEDNVFSISNKQSFKVINQHYNKGIKTAITAFVANPQQAMAADFSSLQSSIQNQQFQFQSQLFQVERVVSDYEWIHPQSAADVFIKVGLLVAAAYFVNGRINNIMNEIDFTELQQIVQECTGLDIRDINYIDSSNPETQSIDIAGKINTEKTFQWMTDENKNYEVPETLRKYIGISSLKIVKMKPWENQDDSDILIVSEEGDDTHFSEAYLRVRTKTGSNEFIQIPVVTLAFKQKLIANAINELLHVDDTVSQLKEMIEELVDEEQILQCKTAYKTSRDNAENLRKKIQNVQLDIETMLPQEPQTS